MNIISKKIQLFKLYLLARKVQNKVRALGSHRLEEYNKTLPNRFLRNIQSDTFDGNYSRFNTTDNLNFSFSKSYVRVYFLSHSVGNCELFTFSFTHSLSFFDSKCYDYKYIPTIKDELNKISKFVDAAKESSDRQANEDRQKLEAAIQKAFLGE